MNKIFKKILFITFTFLFTINVYASNEIGYVNATAGLIVRKDAGTTYSKITTLLYNTKVTILDTKKTADNSTGCSSKTWYKISYESKTGYVCSNYITKSSTPTPSEMAKMTDEEFNEYLKNQGFDNTYITKLTKLHKSHPNWIFKGIKTKYTWSNTLKDENVKGRSLYQVTSTGVKNGLQGYLNTGSAYYNYLTDKFTALDGNTWYQANEKTISYYMDPRNFLTESGIFMFEDLTYYESYQTSDVVKKILYTDFYKNYIQYYMEAAKKYNVSPVYLGTLSRQEVGLESSTATSGKAGTYNKKNYNGYYNFYNIGASSGANPVYNGLDYSISAGWNTPQKAIVEGANWIVSGYISKGQYTRYFQKWNVSPNTTTAIYHQYMTDIHALVSPSSTAAASYNSIGITEESFVFSIPIYSGMPTSTSLPKTGNPNNWLKTIKVDDTQVSNFEGSKTSYDLGTVDYNKESINISTTTINSNASVEGNGTKNLNEGKNTINIIVTAQNGSKKTYTLTITRKEGEKKEISIENILNNLSIKNNLTSIYGFELNTKISNLKSNVQKENSKSTIKITTSSGTEKPDNSILATGDKVTITSNNETKTYQIIIYGDLNEDGEINSKDLLLLRKHLINKTLTGVNLEASKIVDKTNDNSKNLLKLRQYLNDKTNNTISQK